tara:strand:- start:4275 stop:6347 length:2073 start_codon:yes stop_codon:yes gene_type:complete
VCTQAGYCVVSTNSTSFETTDFDGGSSERKIECNSGDTRRCYSGKEATKGVGLCQEGRQTCQFGQWSECVGEVTPKEELCDGHDNDCDGAVDEACKTCTAEPLEQLPAGHFSQIMSVQYSPDGKIFATASTDYTIKLWDAATAKHIATFKYSKSAPSHIKFTGDGKKLVALYQSRQLIVWDVASRKPSLQTLLQSAYVYSLAIHPTEYKFAVTRSGSIDIWSFKTRLVLSKSIPTESRQNFVVFGKDNTLYTTYNNKLSKWDIKQSKLIETGDNTETSYSSMEISDNGRWLAMGSYRYLYVYDLNKSIQSYTQRYTGERSPYGLSFSRDNRHLAVSHRYTYRTLVYDLETKQVISKISLTNDRAQSVTMHPDGSAFVTGSQQGAIHIWKTEDSTLLHRINRIQNWQNNTVAIHASSDHFATVSNEDTIKIWSLSEKKVLRTLETVKHKIRYMAFRPDGKMLVAALRGSGEEQFLHAYEVSSGKLLYSSKKAEDGPINHLTFSPDGTRILTSSDKHRLELWNADDGAHVRTFRGHLGPVYAAQFSPDGTSFVSASWDNTIKWWKVDEEYPIQNIDGHGTEVTAIAFAPNGKSFASGDSNGQIKLWDAQTRQLIHTFEGHQAEIKTLEYSADSMLLLSGSLDTTVRLWNITSKKALSTLSGHDAGIFRVVFGTNTSQLISGAADKTILWSCQ